MIKNEAGRPTKRKPEPKASAARPRGRYISDTILARRRRMLDVAKQMITEGGADAFTLRELGLRAEVSVTTIYTAFGDKQGVIAAAIEDYYLNLPLAQTPSTGSLSALLASKDEVRQSILANPAYARHYAELYFSAAVDSRIYNVIRETSTASGGHLPWLRKAIQAGDVIPGLTFEYLATLFANHRLLVLHDWANGRVSDDELGDALKMAFLVPARAVTRGPTQARVEVEMKKLLRTAPPG